MPLQAGNPVIELSRRGAYRPSDPTAALLDLVGPVDGLHVLVIGPGALETMCGLNERGAAAVINLRADRWVRPESVDLTIVPNVMCKASAALAINHARRAVRPLNSLYLRFMADAAVPLVRDVRRCLIENGFSVGRSFLLRDRTVLVADQPLLGSLKYA